ncbi:MAG: hypothetical protein IJB81_06805 [Clostridia bacterium]|nr:hypothetical protein [Clostridia bacterium]
MQEHNRLDRIVLGIAAAVLTVAAIAYVLLVSPAVTAQKTDAYVPVMEALGLTELEHSAQSGEYGYLRHDVGVMLTGKLRSIAWAGAAVRLMTQPFGLPFSTSLLAAVYAVLIGLGAYLAVSGLARHSYAAAYLTLIAWPLAMLHPALTGYLRSLYVEGAAIAFAMLFLGCMINTLCKPRGCGVGGALGVIFTAALMVNSTAWMLAFSVAAVAGSAICVYHTCAGAKQRGLQLLLAGLMAFVAIMGTAAGFMQERDVHSDAANYLAVFQGMLPCAEDPEAILNELGLDASYAQDIGRSYYEAEENFAHNPRAEDAVFPAQLTFGARLLLLLKHPELMTAMLEERAIYFRDAYSTYLSLPDGGMLNGHAGVYLLMETAFGQGGMKMLVNRALFAAAVSVLLMMTARRRSGLKLLPLCMLALASGLVLYIPLGLAMTGGIDLPRTKAVVLLLSWVLLLYGMIGLLLGLERVFIWLSEKGMRLSPEPLLQPIVQRRSIPVTRGGLLMATAVAWAVIIAWTILPDVHMGGVNNGDYGRMMEQLGLSFAQEQLENPETQAGLLVVEEYECTSDLDWRALTPLDPNYSLIYTSVVARLWSALTGQPFSTYVMGLTLLALTTMSVLCIIRDLYGVLGKLTVLPAVLLTLMLLGENYTAWYNSLFGEGSISTGLMMTLACALHLAVMPRGSKRSWLWLILLAASFRFLVGAKAQMALALPVGAGLLIVLAIYHHPRGVLRCSALALLVMVLVAAVASDGLGIYKKNAGVSERHTVWQSVFFGALMIAEDPDAAMIELGIPLEMKVDIGKHAYYEDADYVYAPLSDEAWEKFYSKVNTFTMVGYYLRHPRDLLIMLDHAAQESVELHTGFMAYTDEEYPESVGPVRMTGWANFRTYFAGRAFWHYVLGYGVIVVGCIWLLCRRKTSARTRMLTVLLLALMFIGVLQYPLSVIGNGFADNNKQLYGFMLCHDLLLVSLLTAGVKRLSMQREQLQQ